MLIVPLENRLDWRHPPLVTVLLVAINTVVFFACLSDDQDAIQRAWQLYNSADLIEVEADPFREFWEQRGYRDTVEALPAADEELVGYILWSLEFDAWLEERPPTHAPPDWRLARDRFEEQRSENSTIGFGLVPAEPRPITALTSMYLHGGVWHLVGNMVFLFLFGFSLERAIGRVSYLAVYHLAGAVSAGLTILVQHDSYIPTIGASGAVSGLMGAYIGVYRLRRIRFFYNVLVYFGEFRAPALWLFPFWLAKELYGQFFGAEGVAYWAHIGGLLGGVASGLLLSATKRGVDERYLESAAQDNETSWIDWLTSSGTTRPGPLPRACSKRTRRMSRSGRAI